MPHIGTKIKRNSIACSILIFLLASMAMISCEKAQQMTKPIVPVEVAAVRRIDMPLQIQAIGTVEPIQAVTIRATVGGYLNGIYFKEGEDVKIGQLLFQIDPRNFDVAQAQAQAALEQARVQSQNADSELQRAQKLREQQFISQEEYDRIRTTAQALQAAVKAQEAALQKARLDRQYATIHSPISGRAGSLSAHRGDLIRANDTALVAINQIHPIQVKFSIPEKSLSAVRAAWNAGEVPVIAKISQNATEPISGKLVFIDNAVDTRTGSILLKAEFANEGESLWPGQFVDVTVVLGTLAGALVIPARAVQTGQEGSFAFIINADKKAEIRQIVTDEAQNDQLIVQSGLNGDEMIVVDGQVRLSSGTEVEIRNASESAQ